MFGMGGTEILVILIVALLFLGPDKLPTAAKQISKGIRDIKKQSRNLQQQIESDETIGGAIRDLKSALRGDEEPVRPSPLKKKKKALPAGEEASILPPEGTAPVPEALPAGDAKSPEMASAEMASGEPGAAEAPAKAVARAKAEDAADAAEADDADDADDEVAAKPAVTLPPVAGEPDALGPPANTADDDAELAAMVRPAAGTIAKGSEPKHG